MISLNDFKFLGVILYGEQGLGSLVNVNISELLTNYNFIVMLIRPIMHHVHLGFSS